MDPRMSTDKNNLNLELTGMIETPAAPGTRPERKPEDLQRLTQILAEEVPIFPLLYGRAAVAAYIEGIEGRLMRSMKSILGSTLDRLGGATNVGVPHSERLACGRKRHQ